MRIEKKGSNYVVLFNSGAIRHFFGSETDFEKWLERTKKKTLCKIRLLL